MHGKVIPELARISPHLVTNIFAVLDEAFSVARKIQAWLLACVGRICERQKFLTWTSPLGFVVEQPYTRIVSVSLCICSNSCSINPVFFSFFKLGAHTLVLGAHTLVLHVTSWTVLVIYVTLCGVYMSKSS